MFLERTAPGVWYAPTTRYLTVASQAVGGASESATGLGRRPGGGLPRRFLAAYEAALLGPSAAASDGDGIVPLSVAHLNGAAQLTFDDVLHGYIGSPWYGDDEVVDRWWPVALDLWREALRSRVGLTSGREAFSI